MKVVEVVHPGRANVSKTELQEKVGQLFKVSETNRVFLFGFRTVFGGGRSTGFALIYDTLEAAKKYEPKHRLARVSIVVYGWFELLVELRL